MNPDSKILTLLILHGHWYCLPKFPLSSNRIKPFSDGYNGTSNSPTIFGFSSHTYKAFAHCLIFLGEGRHVKPFMISSTD